MTEKVNIVGYNEWYRESPWNRNASDLINFDTTYNVFEAEITYFIKDGIYLVDEDKGVNKGKKIALLTECRIMDPVRYSFIEKFSDSFDYIVTYDDILIEKFKEKVIIAPYGGTWITPNLQQIYEKRKLCSYVTSKKIKTEDQNSRISLLDHFYKNGPKSVELFGRGHNPIPEMHTTGQTDGKILALADFAFSIAIENHVQNNYFSEKLMDCFLTGTIPIYHGCSHIKKYFNTDGMIILDKIEDAKSIVPELTLEKYDSVFEAVKENYNSAKKYIDSLSYSYQKLKKGKI